MLPWLELTKAGATGSAAQVDLLTSIMLQVGKSKRGMLGVGLYAENFTDLTKIKVLEGVYDGDKDRVAIP